MRKKLVTTNKVYSLNGKARDRGNDRESKKIPLDNLNRSAMSVRMTNGVIGKKDT